MSVVDEDAKSDNAVHTPPGAHLICLLPMGPKSDYGIDEHRYNAIRAASETIVSLVSMEASFDVVIDNYT
jgi:hypothetical protein